MQENITAESKIVLASDPTYRQAFWYLMLLAGILVLLTGSFFLPEAIRDTFFIGNQDRVWFLVPGVPFFPSMFMVMVWIVVIPNLLIRPFILQCPPWKARQLDRNRRQALEDERTGKTPATFALPTWAAPLPPALTIHLWRNWRATAIAVAVYALLIGVIFWTILPASLANLPSLILQGKASVWIVLRMLFALLIALLLGLPALQGLILAPRQELRATEKGLLCRKGLRLSFIPWSQARLFGVIARKQGVLAYELASETSLIRWTDRVVGVYGSAFPPGMVGLVPLRLARPALSQEEYHEQIDQLVVLVAERTGLPLYDLRLEEDTRNTTFYTFSTVSRRKE